MGLILLFFLLSVKTEPDCLPFLDALYDPNEFRAQMSNKKGPMMIQDLIFQGQDSIEKQGFIFHFSLQKNGVTSKHSTH